jgi:hypothetical protein
MSWQIEEQRDPISSALRSFFVHIQEQAIEGHSESTGLIFS